MQGHAAEAAALGRHAGIGGERLAGVEPECRRAVAQLEGLVLRVVVLDRASQALRVELLGPVHVLDADQNRVDLRVHSHPPCHITVISYDTPMSDHAEGM